MLVRPPKPICTHLHLSLEATLCHHVYLMLWTHIFLGHAVLGLLTHSELNVTSGDAGGHARASEHVFVG